jgi:hypothetical protein
MDNSSPPGAAPQLLSPEEHHWRAERELAEALSTFQSQVQPATALSLEAVVAAARPAFQLGFCFSVRSSDLGTVVLLMHRGGAQQSAESDGHDEDFTLSARLLAGLLGIPVATAPQPSKAEEKQQPVAGEQVGPGGATPAAAAPAVDPAPEAEGEQKAAPLGQSLESAMEPETPPDPEPLSAEEISTLTAMLKAMARSDKEVWRRFSTAFREHFAVPRTARTITDRITQRRHAAFIDRFERELNAAAGPLTSDAEAI